MTFKEFLKDEKFKYLIVGFGNTVFGYISFFLIFYFLFNSSNTTQLLLIVHLINVSFNFITYKSFVFIKRISLIKSFLKFHFTYIALYFINLFLLKALNQFFFNNIYITQAVIIPTIVTVSYLVNKYYSFK